ncbi:MAG TPA: UPF0149 family protein [Dokdonella sp.]|uniref:UPF0149 family protein n=1 Tax=Dokdonella sp. TaxID=2291710 RepID=UPI002D7EAED0|nr:UPF0149 family protein [Dokdonella sp.]HET9033109.1 UPF0149 family protein [Dokdonella sp.]
MSESPISHLKFSTILSKLRAGINASDLHGSLTGYLCAGGKATEDTWGEALALDFTAEGIQDNPAFPQFFRQTRAQLDDVEFGFVPMLPADAAALETRAEALVDWCRGFLGGVGLAGAGKRGNELSADAREIVKDFATIASSNLDVSGKEEDETALVEVIEFVRVGVLLLHSELAPASSPRPATSPTSRSLH